MRLRRRGKGVSSAADLPLGAPPDRWEPWDGTPLPGAPYLRWGYSTGACVTALINAAWLMREERFSSGFSPVLFGDGHERLLPLLPPDPGKPGMLFIRKNGGDDPDSTHGAVLCAKLIPSGKEPDPRGYALSIGRGTLFLESLGGIGLCTRGGLDCDPGHWAFNISVRRMIARNLERLDFGKEPIRLTARVGVENGENLAKTTLNPALGIKGGISILGTTGLVRPFSHDAYIASIRLCVRSLAFSGGDTMFFCTGGRSEKAARLWTREGAGRKIFGSQPDEAFTSIADFIGESVRAAEEYGMRRAVICCMPGKLLKYACGLFNTHAHRTAQDIPRLAERLGLLGADKELVRKTAACATVREALGLLPEELTAPLLRDLASLALAAFRRMLREPSAPDAPAFGILLLTFSGTVYGWYTPEGKIL